LTHTFTPTRTATPALASFGGFVWIDLDHNGLQDPGEPGVAGVLVTLFDAFGNVVATQSTGIDGSYLFTGLTPGSYSVGFAAPAGMVFTAQAQGGNPNQDSDADPSNGQTFAVNLNAGINTVTLDAGLVAAPTATPTISRTPTATRTATRTPTPQPPDLKMAKSHGGVFTVGYQAAYVLMVSNLGSGPTTGTITVSDPLPNGLTLISGVGNGWTCDVAGQMVTCTNPGPLASGAASSIMLVVSVDSSAFPTITNTASVSTAGDTNLNNNSAVDPTTVKAGSSPPAATPTRTPTRTPTSPGQPPAFTPTRTPTPTGVPPGSATPTRTRTSTPVSSIGCTGTKKFRLIWSINTPAQARVFFSATRCIAPPRCFLSTTFGPMTVPPIRMSITDGLGGTINTELPGAALHQGKCPGGVDSYCRSSSLAFHTDRMSFAFGRDGVTTLRAKISIDLNPPTLPVLVAPFVVHISDAQDYGADLVFNYCKTSVRRSTTSVQCY
jgi:uncharacterized repeat protein (TIGR01451 family)